LVKAMNPAQAAEDLLDHDGGDKYEFVRADEVEGEINLIVPVIAASKRDLDDALSFIRGKTRDRAPTVARVTKHHPDPPDNVRDSGTVGRNPWG
jgi:hypothetical protein